MGAKGAKMGSRSALDTAAGARAAGRASTGGGSGHAGERAPASRSRLPLTCALQVEDEELGAWGRARCAAGGVLCTSRAGRQAVGAVGGAAEQAPLLAACRPLAARLTGAGRAPGAARVLITQGRPPLRGRGRGEGAQGPKTQVAAAADGRPLLTRAVGPCLTSDAMAGAPARLPVRPCSPDRVLGVGGESTAQVRSARRAGKPVA